MPYRMAGRQKCLEKNDTLCDKAERFARKLLLADGQVGQHGVIADATLVGQAGLVSKLKLRVPGPAVVSCVGPGTRRTLVEPSRRIERYPVRYAPDNTPAGDLKFALKNEPVDTGVLAAAFDQMDPREIADWVRSEPNGVYARRAWFLYEKFSGRELDLPDAGVVTYAPALDPNVHIVARGLNSRRHKIIDNLLGGRGFCPTVRRTEKLDSLIAMQVNIEAKDLVDNCDPEVLSRAVSYLLTKETKSSFAIEGESPSGSKTERFVEALRHAGDFNPANERALVKLQNEIVDPRYAASSFRDFQNFVGETVGGYREVVHFICPKPEDVSSLMRDWALAASRLEHSMDPVIQAAIIAFGYVFIHPFEDGNGRIHRYIIHHILAAESFSPPKVLFPVSAAIIRDRAGYDAALESFSKPTLDCIDWKFDEIGNIEVLNQTKNLYSYFDCTAIAEFLYEKVVETVRKDLKEELDFVAVYDEAFNAVSEIIDMPNKRVSLIVRLCLQNGGVLSNAKRSMFAEVTDSELDNIQNTIRCIINDNGVARS